MKESHLFLIAAIIFILLAILLFNSRNPFAENIGMLLGFCSFFLLCGGADNAQKGN
jgi:hypothetical protein